MCKSTVILEMKNPIYECLPLFTNSIISVRLDAIQRKQEGSALFIEHPALVFI